MPRGDASAFLKSDLQAELAARILDHISAARLSAGSVLREAELARTLGVSRSPVRAALRHLVGAGIVRAKPRGGYLIGRRAHAHRPLAFESKSQRSLYGMLLKDLILCDLASPTTESALMRRYEAGRGEITQAIRRLLREGLAEPSPGRGWTFAPFTREHLARSYQLRIVLEPATLLERDYRVDRDALEALRRDHRRMADSLSSSIAWSELFALDARFHETLSAGSGNELIVETIRRQNRWRRLCEYLGYVRLDRVRGSMAEHVAIIDSLLDGDIPWAAAQLRHHLMVSRNQTDRFIDEDLAALRSGARELPRLL
jgi:DNA-binding GntR family transcriptional regulator